MEATKTLDDRSRTTSYKQKHEVEKQDEGAGRRDNLSAHENEDDVIVEFGEPVIVLDLLRHLRPIGEGRDLLLEEVDDFTEPFLMGLP